MGNHLVLTIQFVPLEEPYFTRKGKLLTEYSNLVNKEMVLVYTNVRRNTKALVQQVTERREKFPQLISHTMDAIDNASLEAWKSLKSSSEDDGKVNNFYSTIFTQQFFQIN